MNINDKVNIIILFLNKEDKIEKENLFFVSNIKIEGISDYADDVFVLNKFKTNSYPVNFEGFIPLTGYEFHFKKLDDLDYSLAYKCYYMITKKNFEISKKEFLNKIVSNYSKEMNAKLEECKKLKIEIDILNKIKE